MLGSLFQLVAADIHVSLKAEEIFNIGPLHVTNSMFYGVLCTILMTVALIFAAHKIRVRPRKGWLLEPVEMLVEFLITMHEGVFGSRKQAVKYTPIFGVFFLVIFSTYVLGLLPVVGPGVVIHHGGETVPLFRSFTADLNATIGLAVSVIIMVQVLSIRAQGGKKHLQHYFSDKPLNPINMFIGLLEVFGEFTRVLSLSLRLFLNTAVGDILVAVFSSLVLANGRTPLAVFPILLFEILVAGIQAYVFTVLSATYLGLAIAHSEGHHDDHQPADIPEGVDSRGMVGG